MVRVQIANVGMVQTAYSPGLTVAGLLAQLKTEHNFRFKAGSSLQDSSQGGRFMADTDDIMDERTYYLNAWLEKDQSQ